MPTTDSTALLLYRSFNERYRLSQPKAVRTIMDMPFEPGPFEGSPRWNAAKALFDMGIPIDVAIVVRGYSALEAYHQRGQSLDAAQFKIARDLIVTGAQPFEKWPFKRVFLGDDNEAPGTLYQPLLTDTSEPGALYPSDNPLTHQKQRIRWAQGELDLWVKIDAAVWGS